MTVFLTYLIKKLLKISTNKSLSNIFTFVLNFILKINEMYRVSIQIFWKFLLLWMAQKHFRFFKKIKNSMSKIKNYKDSEK